MHYILDAAQIMSKHTAKSVMSDEYMSDKPASKQVCAWRCEARELFAGPAQDSK